MEGLSHPALDPLLGLSRKTIWIAPNHGLKAEIEKRQKNWRKSARQFLHIVCNAQQPPFGIDFLDPPQAEPAEMPVVFDVAED